MSGVLRESLRTTPPAGGGFRVARKRIQIAGFDIDEGVVVTADPRIGKQASVCLSVCLSVFLSVCLSVCLSVYT